MISILFDLDGTLVDSSQGIFNAFRYSFKQMNLTPLTDQDMQSFIGPPLEVTLASFFDTESDVNTAIQHFIDYYHQDGVHEVDVYPNIRETLQRLVDNDCQLFVTTSKHEPMAKLMLEEQGLHHFFKGIYGAIENRYHKSDIIRACLSDYQLDTAKTYIVGDTTFDMIGAVNTQIGAIGVTWGFGSETDLISSGANHICHNPLDLTQITY